MNGEKLNLVELLKNHLTPQKKEKKQTKFDVNRQGLSPEEYQKVQDAKRERTPEDQTALVPIQDFHKPCTELYKKYGLTDEETAFVEATIKPME